ncbi:MAG: peptidylprolyl isomerase [Bryobacteraceae bacterium]
MKRIVLLLALSAALYAQLPGGSSVPPNKVVARVDGKDITAADIQSALANMPQEFGNLYQQNPTMALQQLFMMRYLSSEAEKKKLAEESPLKEQLEAARSNMLAAAMLSYEQNHFTPTVDAVTAYYNANLARFQAANLKVISISFGAPIAANASPEEKARAELIAKMGMKQRTEEEARTLATEALAKLKAGTEFATVLAEYSDDPTTKTKGGDYGPVTSDGSQPEAFKKAIFALKAGDFSEPLRLPGAMIVAHVESIAPQPKSAVELTIVQQLRQDHFGQWVKEMSQRFQPAIQAPEFFVNPRPSGPQMPGLAPR